MNQTDNVSPVIKWAGGKRQLIPIIEENMPRTFNTYYEPFFGGGALFCALEPQSAIISDCNKQLIDMYEQIKSDPSAVCEELMRFQDQYNECSTMEEKNAVYYKLREEFNKCIDNEVNTPLSAAMLIFLNKAGFNGLYRVNTSGKYNVPPAHRKTVKACEPDNIKNMSALLQRTRIMCGDFEAVCKEAKAGDFIFFDPPYYGTFNSYQAGGFSEEEHVRLFNLFRRLSEEGVYCMMTNNDCDFIKDLYRDYAIDFVDVQRVINSNGKDRTGKEVIVTNYIPKKYKGYTRSSRK